MEKAFEDLSSYLRTENPTIDVCLNCTREDCSGVCEAVEIPKNFIVRRTHTTSSGITKTSYVTSVSKGVVHTGGNVFKALRRSEKGAESLLETVKKLSKIGSFEIIKRGDEIERLAKEKYKTHRSRSRMYVDACGNRLGR